MLFPDRKDSIVSSTSCPNPRSNLFHERCTGLLGEDRASVEEFQKKVSSHSGEYDAL